MARNAVIPPVALMSARQTILDNRRILRALEEQATRYVAFGNPEMALRVACAAADWSWFNHTGVFASPRLERLLRDVGRSVVSSKSRRTKRGTKSRRVLHVLTQVYPTGGHTRLAWRWMGMDPGSIHSAVLVSQYGSPVPAEFSKAITGELYELGEGSFVGKCKQLTEIIGEHDVVLLNVHPHETVATATCAGLADRPPTYYLNHADHVFWLGAAAADFVVNFRPAGSKVCQDRRAILPARMLELPLPLSYPSPSGRTDFRTELHISDDEVVLLTVAAPYKFATEPGDLNFAELAAMALKALPNVHFVVIGPTVRDDPWRDLERQFPERVHALGERSVTSDVMQGADIYLDSFPFSAVTAVLDAAVGGLPVLCFQPGDGGPLYFDDFSVRPHRASTPDAWLSKIEEWVESPDLRRIYASTIQAQALQAHSGPGWEKQWLSALRASTDRLPASLRAVNGKLRDYDLQLLGLHRHGGLTRDHMALLAAHGFRPTAGQPTLAFP